jgi:hypothetical protein
LFTKALSEPDLKYFSKSAALDLCEKDIYDQSPRFELGCMEKSAFVIRHMALIQFKDVFEQRHVLKKFSNTLQSL